MRNLKATDPELAALWENFVDNDVRPHGSLDARTRHLILLAGHVAAQSPNEYRFGLAAGAGRRGQLRSRPKRPCIRQFPMSAGQSLRLCSGRQRGHGRKGDSTASGRTVADDAAKSSGKRTGRPKGNLRLTYRRDARFGARGTETYSGLPFGQLFRRLLYPRRFEFENPANC